MKAQSVSELVQKLISNLEHNSKRRKYTADTVLQNGMELSLLVSVISMDTGKMAISIGGTGLTVQRLAQLIWDKYYDPKK